MSWRMWWWLSRGAGFAVGFGLFLGILAIWTDDPEVEGPADIAYKLGSTCPIFLVPGIVLAVLFLLMIGAGEWRPPRKPDKDATVKD